MADWKRVVEKQWTAMRFGEMKVETSGNQLVFEAQVYLNDLDPNAARVELYADGINGGGPVRQEMECTRQLDGASGGYVYRARVPATRPASDYTVRVIPHHSGVAVPLEAARILWQR
jgi:starch phosphorylase